MISTRRPGMSGCFVILPALLLASCGLLQVREDVTVLQQSTVLVGVVSGAEGTRAGPVLVAAYTRYKDEVDLAHYTTLHELGSYELMVPAGRHDIVAFVDGNRNLTLDAGEPAGQLRWTERSVGPTGGVDGNLDILVADGAMVDLPLGFSFPPKEHGTFHSTCPGALLRLDDPVFSDEYAQKGLWEGLEFFREIGGNVYFLEPYDPARTPILFVHGAGGSPQNWRAFFEGIDRSRYQPWVFYYPSGSSIDSMSHLLLWKMQNLQARYGFDELILTAHSMGGLVTRSFLVKYGRLFPSITTFVSISTPWGGEELAEKGVKYSPGVIPVWRDMQPGSPLLESLYSQELPPGVNYYLFFGHRGNRSLLRRNNDEVVTLASQLDQRCQRDAKMIYGYDEGHVSILSSEQVIAQYNLLLADAARRAEEEDGIQGNRLVVDFTFDAPEDRPRPMPALALGKVDEEGPSTWIYLSPEDSGRMHGPFAPGDYDVSLLAPAYLPEPLSLPVQIEEGSIPRVEFTLHPVGCLRGYLAQTDRPHRQAGQEPRPDAEVKIRSITLSGSGITRSVEPLPPGEWSYDDLYPVYCLSQKDYVHQGAFFFFGLPAGRYELTVDAEGYQPYSETRDVIPGDYKDTVVVELVEE